jgi:hypothetical protein
VIEAAVWLHTDQLSVLAVGKAVKVSPPLAPHPVTAFGFVAKAVEKAEVVAKPVMVTVAVVVQVLAAMAVVGKAIAIFVIPVPAGVTHVDTACNTPLTVVGAATESVWPAVGSTEGSTTR